MLSGPHLHAREPIFFVGRILIKKNVLRAADLIFSGRIWPAGRILPTPSFYLFEFLLIKAKKLNKLFIVTVFYFILALIR